MENRVDVPKIVKNYPKFTFFSNMIFDVAMIISDCALTVLYQYREKIGLPLHY